MSKFDADMMKSADELFAEARKKAKQKISLGHDYIYDYHPIGVPWIAKWKVVEDLKIPTMCTNGKVLKYNPEFTNRLTLNAVKWVVLHEAMHLMLGHHVRIGDRNHLGWNAATDLAINSLLKEYAARLGVYQELVNEIKVLMPREGEFAKLPHMRSGEWYYRQLEKDAYNEPPPPPGDEGRPCDEGQPGEGEGQPSDGKGDGEGEGKGEGQPGEGESPGTGTQGEGSEGESVAQEADGKSSTERYKDAIGEHTVIGEVEPSATIDEKGMDYAEAEYEETATEAVVLMKSQGKGAGYGVEFIEEMITKKALNNWAKLREYIHKLCFGGLNYKRPHRRRSLHDIIFPSRKSKGKSKGAVITDTSGSMGRNECDEAIVQISAVLEEWPKTEITLVQCDVQIHDSGTKEFTSADMPLRIPRNWHGRGGTNMQPAIDWLTERKTEFDWAIFVTDMGFSYNSMTESGIPTIFVGVNAGSDIHLPQRSYSYMPVIVD